MPPGAAARKLSGETPAPKSVRKVSTPQIPSQTVDQGQQTDPAASKAVVAALERLADLHKKRVLTNEEVAAKTSDLLARI
jgi:hypothetical protein